MNKKLSGFTLIELMISMTIFFIIVVMTYANYAYFQNIAKVKIALKEISQSINESRNIAVSGYDKNGVNQSIGVYFDTLDKNMIRIYSFDYNSGITLDDSHLIKTKKLQQDVGIDDISEKSNMLVYFSSIYAKPELYVQENGVLSVFSGSQLDFQISYKNAKSGPLSKTLKYFKNTNVVDY